MIQDSGTRREFPGGAVRDMADGIGKGRCDLLPLDVVCELMKREPEDEFAGVYLHIHHWQITGDAVYLLEALALFAKLRAWDPETMILELAKHFEEGATKYGERNWQKGIPTWSFTDSAIRHYAKWTRGDEDERHDRAFCWNLVCAIWTAYHRPDLHTYHEGIEIAEGEG